MAWDPLGKVTTFPHGTGGGDGAPSDVPFVNVTIITIIAPINTKPPSPKIIDFLLWISF